MALYKSGNPALNKQIFAKAKRIDQSEGLMTLQGTIDKVAFLLVVLALAAAYVWGLFRQSQDFATVAPLCWIGCIGGFVVALIIIFKQSLAPYLAPLYAMLEGLALGGISALTDRRYPGVAIQSLALTFAVFVVLVVIYKLKIIEASENFALIVCSATGGVALYYLFDLLLMLVGRQAPLIHSNSLLGIGFSVVVVIVASLNLVVDFDFIEQGCAKRAPKHMEWYGAFGLVVTLVWLYLELLRLLSKLRSRD